MPLRIILTSILVVATIASALAQQPPPDGMVALREALRQEARAAEAEGALMDTQAALRQARAPNTDVNALQIQVTEMRAKIAALCAAVQPYDQFSRQAYADWQVVHPGCR